MNGKNKKKHRIVKITAICLLITALLCAAAFFIYVSDYSRAQEEAVTAMTESGIIITEFEGGIAFGDTNAKNGFIFYPGGKVEYTAYAPLLRSIADENIFCVMVKMPYNLAVFDGDSAANILPLFPEVEHWYIGGHSLGGVMAADYADKNSNDFKGLILLASYPAADMSDCSFGVLSIYGSEDTVLNKDEFIKSRSLMPPDYEEICIEGGNHAQFGDYGLQEGDQAALISASEQRKITTEAIIKFFTGNSD